MISKPLAWIIDTRLLRDYYQLTKPRVVALLLLTAWVGMSGLIYLVGSLTSNLWFCWHGWLLKRSDRPAQAMRTFRFSIYHLMLLFSLLILGHHWLWRLSKGRGFT